MGHDHIGTEHILLGIVRDHEGAAAAVLGKHASREAVRAHVRSRLEPGGAPATATATATADPAAPPLCGRCGAGLTDALTTTEVQVPEHAEKGGWPSRSPAACGAAPSSGCSPEDPDVFERFTDRPGGRGPRQEEARLHNHNYIAPSTSSSASSTRRRGRRQGTGIDGMTLRRQSASQVGETRSARVLRRADDDPLAPSRSGARAPSCELSLREVVMVTPA